MTFWFNLVENYKNARDLHLKQDTDRIEFVECRKRSFTILRRKVFYNSQDLSSNLDLN